MTDKELRQLLAVTEEKLHRCWGILSTLKSKPDDIAQFQSHLSDILFNLSRKYQEVCRTRRELIRRQGDFARKWFKKREQSLSQRRDTIARAIGIGKSMGDAFAWFFYHNDADLLYEHFRHHHSAQLPSGIGGFGEQEFVRNSPLFAGQMVLYHGCTSILRLGDVSLVDLGSLKVSAIGELKTQQVSPGELSILVSFLSRNELELPEVSALGSNESSWSSMPEPMKIRFERQLKSIGDAISPQTISKKEPGLDLAEESYFREFEKFFYEMPIGRFNFRQFGPGLVMGLYRSSDRCLYRRLHRSALGNLSKRIAGVEDHVRRILISDSPYNAIEVGGLQYLGNGMPNAIPGTMPLFWRAADLEMVRELLFQQAIAIIIYNPAHFYRRLENSGFTIETGKEHEGPVARFTRDGYSAEVHALWYFKHLITHSLFDEDCIVGMIREFLDKVGSPIPATKTQFDLRFVHRLFGRR